jgi:hypothetical protein
MPALTTRCHARPRHLGWTVLALVAGCSHQPPADFAPDPGLVAQIRDIRIVSVYPRVCPGGTIFTSYEAVLADGSRVPFARSYDKNHPPRLHIVFLDRTSPDAVTQQDGDWVANGNPLTTVATGFRLTATLQAKPSATSTIVIPPDYSCMRHAFAFSGEPGEANQPGGNGPDVTVRLAVLPSPFYNKLFVAGVEVGFAPPFYVLGDATTIPPAGWLLVESRGGRGGTGADGTPGTEGVAGAAGCPAQAGGPGGNAAAGAPGGTGGRGGRVSVVVPADNPFLAGIVEARSSGGRGGEGGHGGAGGRGGKGGVGGVDASKRPCPNAPDGASGLAGVAGPEGAQGPGGSRSVVVSLPMNQLFGVQVPPELGALLERLQRRP